MASSDVLRELRTVIDQPLDRLPKARRLAETIRGFGNYRWVGIYDVDAIAGVVRNVAWDGPGEPAYPVFPMTEGLTSRAIAGGRTVNIGDVAQAADYLTAFGSTRSEIIVPLVDPDTGAVVGTLDVKSERENAFDPETQAFLEACVEAMTPFWIDSWEWPAEKIKRVGYKVIDLIADHLTRLPESAVFRPFPEELSARYLDDSPAPEWGQSAEAILAAFQSEIQAFPFGNGHPRFYGWVNSPPTVIGAFAEALAAAVNPSCSGGNHAAVYVERQVVNWFKRLLNFPGESMGLLVSGGSMAALTALAVARHVKCGFDVRGRGLQGASSPLVFYKAAEGHGCNQKAIELMGIGSDNLRLVDQDCARRMIPSSLEDLIESDLESGRTPVAVIASAGATNTGAIDPLDEIADICQGHGVWLHVDGAYGGPAILTERYQSELAALARADSVAIDPHKWLYVPIEAGLVLVRDAQAMRATFSLVPPYLRTDGSLTGVGGPPWFTEYGFQQTRGFRALKIWMAIKYHGIHGYRKAIEKDIALADRLTQILRADGDFEVFEPQNLSVVCFRYLPRSFSRDNQAINSLNQALLERVQLGGQAFLSSTVMNDAFWLRACIINPRTSAEDVEALVETVRAAGADCLP
jgi:glutamate/tyrosine decarboxylase-like PLP-dependent enzyme/putative methionine-R-sulfoxide reductase with GAF domain